MKTIRTFNVAPLIPAALLPLKELAYNVWWAWDHDAQDLFIRVDPQVWEQSRHNPVKLLALVAPERLQELAGDIGFTSHLSKVSERMRLYLQERGWFHHAFPEDSALVAYFSAEFGLTESLAIYSGGLGLLAGDHLKAASDLGIPLVGVGLLYSSGYFTQSLNADGWQQEAYTPNDWASLPVQLARDPQGQPVSVQVEYPEGPVTAHVWRVDVGRVPLLLLDTNIAQNGQAARAITSQLYAGDREMRIRQELLLGVGGLRALKALGLRPTVCHMNEGHSAFLALERICELMAEHQLGFDEARAVSTAGNAFTTHTPVPAGNDEFSPALTERYLKPWQQRLGLATREFLALGRRNPADADENFCMTVLAIRLSSLRNGVSALHGEVSRKMWQSLYPDLPAEDVPIGSITNGVHFRSWISRDVGLIFDRYLGPRWHEDPDNRAVWERVEQIPDEELWIAHERRRERLVAFARRRLAGQLERRGATRADIKAASEALQPDALTIGFARRFAAYKRGTLLLRNLERLTAILGHPDRPVQIIIAGKAHPRDDEGKHLIRQIVHTARNPALRSRVVFLEDYDIDVARRLVQGADLWLNTPRRPLEASGTSGMKASANGVLNLSVLDGWWCEAYQPQLGWAIGRGEEYTDLSYQDEVESNAVYDLLEKEIVPLFYRRGDDGLPREWITRMKQALKLVSPTFNTTRMLEEYVKLAYVPAHRRFSALSADGFRRGQDLAQWMTRLVDHWPAVQIERVEADIPDTIAVHQGFTVRVHTRLGGLRPEDVRVEVLSGQVDPLGRLEGQRQVMVLSEAQASGERCVFSGALDCDLAGRMGFGVRLVPAHADLGSPFDAGMVHWA